MTSRTYWTDVSSFVESERLWNAIKSLPYFDPQPTDTHFFLVRCTHPAIGSGAELKEILAQRYGLLVRDATNFGYSSPHDTYCSAAPRGE